MAQGNATAKSAHPPTAAAHAPTTTYSEGAISILRALSDLSHSADDFFEKVDNSLNYNYDMEMAQLDLDQLKLKLEALEKAFEQMHASYIAAADAGKRSDVVLSDTMAQKRNTEAEYQKLAQVATAALSAFRADR